MLAELLLAKTPVTLALAGVMLLLWLFVRRPTNIPPGPWITLPIVGNLLQIGSDPMTSFRRMRKQYGDVFSVYIGNRLVIVINGYDCLKEALVHNGHLFSHRPHLYFTKVITDGKGIIGRSGELWKEQKRFTSITLRSLVIEKNILEFKIQEEMAIFIEELAKLNGAPTDVRHILETSVCNILSSIVFGKRFENDDPKLVKYLQIVNEIFTSTPMLNFFPFLRFLPGDLFKVKRITRGIETIQQELFKASIEHHISAYDEDDDDTNDFISAYIKEIKKKEKLADANTSMDYDNLCAVIQDLMLGGVDTTATFIRWLILIFLHFPDVQKKCFTEIKEHLGFDGEISIKDRANLDYLEATLMETMRFANITPMSLIHAVPQEFTFKGFRIPRDALVIPNLDSVLFDVKAWGDPEKFRVERFLDEKGRVVIPEEWVPFSMGPRSCTAKFLARIELFLFVAAMIQKFEFVKADVLPPLEGVLGFTHAPEPFFVRAVVRQ